MLAHRYRIATIVVILLCLGCVLSVRALNIAVSGFNEDVVTENAPTHFGHRFDSFAPNPADWIENGLSGAVGLPSSRTFTSDTGSGVNYVLQSYTAPNVLRMGDGDPTSRTMLVAPGTYAALHILAASGTDGSAWPSQLGQMSAITLNFADGPVTLTGALRAYDWNIDAASYNPATGTYNFGPTGSVEAIGFLDRNYIGQFNTASSNVSPGTQGDGFFLYETALDLVSLGLSDRTLQSMTFRAVNSSHSPTSIFAIDATVPEPSSVYLLSLVASGLMMRRSRRPAIRGIKLS